MPYAIHLRKSRADIEAEKRGEGESLSRHRRDLYALADRLGIAIDEEYCEIISGSKLSERPEMQRLLNDVANGKWDGVLDVEIARLTRGDLIDQGVILNTFKFSGTRIITPQHTYNLMEDWDEDNIITDMSMSRREYKFINRRLQKGRNVSAAEGLWQSPAPFGYNKVKLPREKGWTLEPDPIEAPLVRMIFDMYVHENAGGAKIAQRLNSMGSRTKRGNLWTASSIGQLSANPVYIGKVRWNDRTSTPRMVGGEVVVKRIKNASPLIVDGRHPAIIPLDLWEAAQRARKSHDLTRNHVSAPVRNPLAGIVLCSICGHAMTRKDNCGSKGSKYDMLRCPNPSCITKSIALSIVEESILETLHEWITIGKDQLAANTPKEEDASSPIAVAKANIERLKAQRERIFAAFEDGAYDSQTFIRRRTEKDREIESAENTLSQLEQSARPSSREIIALQLPRIKYVLDAYDKTTDVQQKNMLLKSVISRVLYTKTKRCFRNENPAESLTLRIFPRLPSE